MGTLGGYLGLTCFPDKDLLWWAQGSLSHGVVHAHPDLITLVLAQIYGREWESGTQVIEPAEARATDWREEDYLPFLVPYVALGRKQVSGKP